MKKSLVTVHEDFTTHRILHKPCPPNSSMQYLEGKLFTCFEHHKLPKLNIVNATYLRDKDSKPRIRQSTRYTVSIRNGKVQVYVRKPNQKGVKRPYNHSNSLKNISLFVNRSSEVSPMRFMEKPSRQTSDEETASFWNDYDSNSEQGREASAKAEVYSKRQFLRHCRRFHQLVFRWARKHSIQIPSPATGVYQPDAVLYFLCYPALRNLHDNLRPKGSRIALAVFRTNFHRIPQQVSECLREPTFQKAVHKLLGRHNKRLMKALYNSMKISGSWLTPLMVAKILHKHLPIDYIYEILESPGAINKLAGFSAGLSFNLFHPKTIKTMRREPLQAFLPLFSPQKWKQFLLSVQFNPYNDFGSDLTDLPRMINEAQQCGVRLPETFNSVKDYHDQLAFNQNGYNRRTGFQPNCQTGNVILPIHFQNFEAQGWQFVCPLDSQTLRDWGQALHNCMGSYAGFVKNNGFIIGVFREEKIVYGISVRHIDTNVNQLEQFYGVCNSHPPEDHKKQIIEILKNKAILSQNSNVPLIDFETHLAQARRREDEFLLQNAIMAVQRQPQMT